MQVFYPFHIDGKGLTATAPEADHIRQMIEQVLFTNPGERVNRPDFGSGVRQLVFAPNSPELAATTESLVQAALQKWLGEAIRVEAVQVESEDAKLRISVHYTVLRREARQVATFERSLQDGYG
ncbi:MAG TPA: hypothetical protein ENI90_09480 [Methylothermaceae bacterium]|nr:hypothetical protein [Methylothermaceae bacterium]